MSIFKNLSNFKDGFEGGAPNNRFNDTNIRQAISLWTSGRWADRSHALARYGHISIWDVSQVTDMSELFKGIDDFNDDISNWNVGNVTNMEEMFSGASAFNQPIGQWNVSKVTTMVAMFWDASAFNQPLANWERNNSTVSNVTTMEYMFNGARAFDQPLEQWNVRNVTNMQFMFRRATAFLQRYPNADEDPRSVFISAQTNTSNSIAFDNGTLRTAVNLWFSNRDEAIRLYGDINTWNVSQVTDMNNLFRNRSTFNDDISNWNVSNVTDMNNMFMDARAFDLPLEQWNVSKVTDMRSMFFRASRFNQPLANWERNNSTVVNVTNMDAMFYGALAFNQPLEQWNVNDMTDMDYMFRYATAFLQRYPNADNDPRSVFTTAETNNLSNTQLLQYDPRTRKTIACGVSHSVALRNDGTIKTWGSNSYDQRLDSPTDAGYIAIACGGAHSVALHNDGTIRTWGRNENDQRDDSPTDTGYIAIACGSAHSVALRNDGTIKTWGRNENDQRDDSPTDTGYIAIACGGAHSVALRNDGTIRTWGSNRRDQRKDSPTDDGYIAIACGEYHSVALRNDGTIITWGKNNDSQRDDSPTDTGYIAIACGLYHSVALRNDGTIITWGDGGRFQTDDSPTDAGYIAIACGEYHSVALRNDGTIITWGDADENQHDDSPTDNGYIAIACGEAHSVALRNNGTIKTWGNNVRGLRNDSPTSNNFMIPNRIPINNINLNEEPVQESDDSIIARFYNDIFKIETGNEARIDIERDNVFESLKQHITDRGDSFFYIGHYINFYGERGIDQGGLSREFFSLLSNELTEKYFFSYNGYSSFKNDNDKPLEDFNLIGKMFAYAIQRKHNLNIKLNPIILDFLINSEEIDKIDITETVFSQLFKMFDSTTQEQSLKILEKISKENNITKRIRKDLNTLEKLKKFLNDYDKNILGSSPYSTYLSLNEEKWSEFAKICLNDPGFNCMMFENPIDVPFKYKDDFLLFIIRSFTFTQYLEEFYEFIKGFESIINLDNLKPFNLKLLNKLIIGDRTLDIDEFLVNLKIVNATEQKQQIIKDVIRKINEENNSSEKDDYLNKFLYLITGSDSLPYNGWQSFTGDEFRLVFNNTTAIKSHTCDDFKYVEIPNSVIAGNDIEENLYNILSYDSIVESGQSRYCMAGGGISNGLIDRLRNFLN